MHLTTTNPVSGVWRQNTRAGVIPTISFTRLSRMRCECAHMCAFLRMGCECAHVRACSRMGCECAHMRAFRACDANARTCAHSPACDAMRCECAHAMRCECAHQGGTYACPVLYLRMIGWAQDSAVCCAWTSVEQYRHYRTDSTLVGHYHHDFLSLQIQTDRATLSQRLQMPWRQIGTRPSVTTMLKGLYSYCVSRVSSIKQTTCERGREVGHPSVSLFFDGFSLWQR